MKQPKPPLTQKELTIVDDKEVLIVEADLPPNFAGVDKGHYHPGDEIIYVLEGSITFKVQDEPDIALQAGESCSIPAGQVHFGQIGDKGVKFLSIHIQKTGETKRRIVVG